MEISASELLICSVCVLWVFVVEQYHLRLQNGNNRVMLLGCLSVVSVWSIYSVCIPE